MRQVANLQQGIATGDILETIAGADKGYPNDVIATTTSKFNSAVSCVVF